MCDVCRTFAHSHDFDCPMVTEWPDHPWNKETRISEAHGTARFRRENPELAEKTVVEVANKVDNCDHESHTVDVQMWQEVRVVVQICDQCGATKSLFQDW